MSANIDAVAHVSTVRPWWGIGIDLTGVESDIPGIMERLGLSDYHSGAITIDLPDGEALKARGYQAVLSQRGGVWRIHQIANSSQKIHQPSGILETFRQFFEDGEMTMETVGTLQGGDKLFAMARLSESASIGEGDELIPYYLISTAFDGSQATRGNPTTVCVVCENTHCMALNEAEEKGYRRFRQSHRKEWGSDSIGKASAEVARTLGLFKADVENAQYLASVSVPAETAIHLAHYLSAPKFSGLLDTIAKEHDAPVGQELLEIITAQGDFRTIQGEAVAGIHHDLAHGDLSRVGAQILEDIISGKGSQLETRKNTAWGAYQGVTHYVDHSAGRNPDTSMSSAWFGPGSKLKERAREVVIELADASQAGTFRPAITSVIQESANVADLGLDQPVKKSRKARGAN